MQKISGKKLGSRYSLTMQKIGSILKHINKQENTNMQNTETYEAVVQGIKDIHDKENPVKYWLSVSLDGGAERKLYVDQSCRHINKFDRVKVTGYVIKKPGSNNQSCVKIEPISSTQPTEQGETMQTNGYITPAATKIYPTPTANTNWAEKYRLTMSNLLSSILPSRSVQEYDDVYKACDKVVRDILTTQEDGSVKAPF